MLQKGNFLILEQSEFREWLQKQKVTRNIKGAQVHHTASPNYSTRKVIQGIGTQDKFVCLEGMRTHHIDTNKWKATGQHISVFEDGSYGISLDRPLNMIGAGISNNNSGWIVVEVIGNFDKGGDTMLPKQREAVIHLYACLAEKFHFAINTNTVVYHAWYTGSGTRLQDYVPGKSSKTCPGTGWFGDGNSVAAANKTFLPAIRVELDRLKNPVAVKDNANKGDDEKLNLTNYQWSVLETNIGKLIENKVINDKSWLDKAKGKTLTVSELSWLTFVVGMK